MTTRIKQEDQFLLRVKRNSDLDRAMRLLAGADCPLPISDVNAAGGKAHTYPVLRILARSVDNIHVEHNANREASMRYVDVNPGVPVAVGHDIVGVSAAVPELSDVFGRLPELAQPQMQDVKWPQAPPMIESIEDMYRQPAWFNTMKTMVEHGRHIALVGPPGVGKDTAVQELAAREGRILVTIGGDGGFRRRDLVGNLQIASGKSFFEVAEYAAAVVNGWWVLLTEVNAADADALLFINAQLAAPYIVTVAGKAYAVHPEFRLFVSYNAGLVGTKPLPQAFKDRFFSIQVPFFNESQLNSILIAHGAPDNEVTTEISKFGVELWKLHERGQVRYQVTSRRLMDAVTLLQADVASSTAEALELAVIAAIDSPVEQNVVKQVLNTFRRSY